MTVDRACGACGGSGRVEVEDPRYDEAVAAWEEQAYSQNEWYSSQAGRPPERFREQECERCLGSGKAPAGRPGGEA